MLVRPGRAPLTAFGTCEGEILDAPLGEGGFGYDPLFFSPELRATFAEADADAKNRVSHRARAIAQLLALLEAQDG